MTTRTNTIATAAATLATLALVGCNGGTNQQRAASYDLGEQEWWQRGTGADAPSGARLVAETSTPNAGFVFETPGGGTLSLYTGSRLRATLQVGGGSRVELNEWLSPTSAQPWTRLTVDGTVRFTSQTRASDHRLFFDPVAEDEWVGPLEQVRTDPRQQGGGMQGGAVNADRPDLTEERLNQALQRGLEAMRERQEREQQQQREQQRQEQGGDGGQNTDGNGGGDQNGGNVGGSNEPAPGEGG